MWATIQTQILAGLEGLKVGDMDFFQKILYLIAEYGPSYMRGAGNTLVIALVSTIIGCLIGLGVGIVQTIPLSKKDSIFKKIVVYLCRGIMAVYVEVFRGTPMMVQAMFIYFGIPVVFGFFLPLWPTAFWSFPSTQVHTWRKRFAVVFCPLIQDRRKVPRPLV